MYADGGADRRTCPARGGTTRADPRHPRPDLVQDDRAERAAAVSGAVSLASCRRLNGVSFFFPARQPDSRYPDTSSGVSWTLLWCRLVKSHFYPGKIVPSNASLPVVHHRPHDPAAHLLERLHDVRLVRSPEEPQFAPVVCRGSGELGDRTVRVPPPGAREPDRLHAAEPCAAKDPAG